MKLEIIFSSGQKRVDVIPESEEEQKLLACFNDPDLVVRLVYSAVYSSYYNDSDKAAKVSFIVQGKQ